MKCVMLLGKSGVNFFEIFEVSLVLFIHLSNNNNSRDYLLVNVIEHVCVYLNRLPRSAQTVFLERS